MWSGRAAGPAQPGLCLCGEPEALGLLGAHCRLAPPAASGPLHGVGDSRVGCRAHRPLPRGLQLDEESHFRGETVDSYCTVTAAKSLSKTHMRLKTKLSRERTHRELTLALVPGDGPPPAPSPAASPLPVPRDSRRRTPPVWSCPAPEDRQVQRSQSPLSRLPKFTASLPPLTLWPRQFSAPKQTVVSQARAP